MEATPVHVEFSRKHFNQALAANKRQVILEDFPKPACCVVQAPKLDSELKEQIRKKGKDPQFGQEKVLYKIQEQLLEVTGPLTCQWSDLLRPNSEVTAEEVILLIQRALVLLGSTSHAVSLERRQAAWARINPSLKSLAGEDYAKREGNLFGPGFLEKAFKKLETEKTLAKVTDTGSRKCPYSNRLLLFFIKRHPLQV